MSHKHTSRGMTFKCTLMSISNNLSCPQCLHSTGKRIDFRAFIARTETQDIAIRRRVCKHSHKLKGMALLLASSDTNHELDEIEARHQFRHGMLNLRDLPPLQVRKHTQAQQKNSKENQCAMHPSIEKSVQMACF